MPRIVHLGLGAFHRAHQAWYTAQAGGDWPITGVSMRGPAQRDLLRPGGGAYDLGRLGADGLDVTRIAVHDRVLVVPEGPGAVGDALADPATRVVTLTVTEAGYHLDPNGHLDLAAPAIAADLATTAPRTAIGLIAHALARRAAAGAPPLTVLSCDNLAANGTRLRAAVARFVAAAGLPAACLAGAGFPDSMVDRITPAVTPATAETMAAAAGRPVLAPVLTEAYSAWVIGRRGLGGIPDWQDAGAERVDDTAPHERRKLLMLNAAHSALAYGGLRRGARHVHDAIADPGLAAHLGALWAEAAPLLPEFPTQALAGHAATLRQRFAVPGLAHRLDQIARDGTLKLRERVRPTLLHHRFAAPAATRVIADWIALQSARLARGDALDDPRAEALADALSPRRPAAERAARAVALIGIAPGDAPAGWLAQVAPRDT